MALTTLATPNTVTSEEPAVNTEELTTEGVAATAQQEEAVETQAAAPATEQADKPVAQSPQPEQTQAVATAKPSSPAVVSQNIEQDMADMGFDGLSIGGMSFDRIKLPSEGVFLFGQDEVSLGKEFKAIINSTRAIYIIRQSDDENAENFYSYQPDGLVDTNGADKSDTLAEWREDGYENPVVRRYLEVIAQLVDVDASGVAGERDGLLVMLSIPPASIQRISGYLMQLIKIRRVAPSSVVTSFQVGNKVKIGNNNFYPWTAKFNSMV